LELTGSIISIDAIGCQTEIASKLLAANADYLLAVKGNQKDLLLEISENFEAFKSINLSEEWDCGHGRSEKRVCKILSAKAVLVVLQMRTFIFIPFSLLFKVVMTEKVFNCANMIF
jgi:predicted transposase YbfD/YdcC